MERILSDKTVSVSELKKNLSSILKSVEGEPIAVLNHNTTSAYILSAKDYEALIDSLEDYQLGMIIKEREAEKHSAKEVNIDEL